MAVKAIRKLFAEVATDSVKAQSWYASLPEAVYCTVHSYNFGEPITLPDKGHLAVVLSGQVEICDESRLGDRYIAYRPIRIMHPGDIFNDFTVADAIVGVPEMDRGEAWSIYAGFHSVLILDKVADDHLFLDEDDYVRKAPHSFLKNNSKRTTEIAILDFDAALFTQPHDGSSGQARRTDFFVEILCGAWRKAFAYRVGLNSYRLAALIAFRKTVERSWKAVQNKHRIDTKHMSPNTMRALFADALFEALDRPLRGDPVFAYQPDCLDVACWQALEQHAKPDNVLTACDPAKVVAPFYYPVDLHNLEINLASRSHPQVAVTALGYQRSSRTKDGEMDTHPQEFYLNVANVAIKSYCKAGYLYDVSCVPRDSLAGRMLLLEFKTKTPTP